MPLHQGPPRAPPGSWALQSRDANKTSASCWLHSKMIEKEAYDDDDDHEGGDEGGT